MTTYDSSAVSNTVIAYEKPITLQQGRALRDNPLAIAEGAAGAPRVQTAAMEPPAAGSVVIARYPNGGGATTNTSITLPFHVNVLVAGVIRFAATMQSSSATGTQTLTLRKNGTTVATLTITGTTAATVKTADITVAVGDTLTATLISSSGTITITVSNIEIRSNSANLAVA